MNWMKRTMKILVVSSALAIMSVSLPSCRITPTMSMGVGFDYYGGGFHARPYGNVGFHGHP